MCAENDAYRIVGNQCGGVACKVSGKILSWNRLLPLIAEFGVEYNEDCACEDCADDCGRLDSWDLEAACYEVLHR